MFLGDVRVPQGLKPVLICGTYGAASSRALSKQHQDESFFRKLLSCSLPKAIFQICNLCEIGSLENRKAIMAQDCDLQASLKWQIVMQ